MENQTPAYQEGWESYRTQQGNDIFPNQGQNPYHKNSSDYHDWAKGWNDRCRDDDEQQSYYNSYFGE